MRFVAHWLFDLKKFNLNVLIVHAYSDSNKGDLAIVASLVKAIRVARPGCTIRLQSVYSEAHPDFEFHHRFVLKMGVPVEQMGVPSPYVDSVAKNIFSDLIALRNLIASGVAEWLAGILPPSSKLFRKQAAALASIKRSDIVILKGGQYIYNDQNGVRGFLYLWRILHPIFIAHKLGRPVVMLGQSVGPLVDVRGRNMTSRALALCKVLVVREKKSEALMEELGLKNLTELAPDFAFLIDPVRPDRFDAVARQIEGAEWLGVTVVNWSFPDEATPSLKRKAYIDAISEVAQRIYVKKGLRIALFPQVTVQHHGESDLDLLNVLAERLEELKVPFVLVTGDLAPEELSYLYGCCQVLLGTRLHSCILAACAKTPVVAIRYQGFKTEGVMAELGLADQVFDISKMDINGIENAICRSYECRDVISKQLGSTVMGFRVSLISILNRVLP